MEPTGIHIVGKCIGFSPNFSNFLRVIPLNTTFQTTQWHCGRTETKLSYHTIFTTVVLISGIHPSHKLTLRYRTTVTFCLTKNKHRRFEYYFYVHSYVLCTYSTNVTRSMVYLLGLFCTLGEPTFEFKRHHNAGLCIYIFKKNPGIKIPLDVYKGRGVPHPPLR